jgi:hypothetical protein
MEKKRQRIDLLNKVGLIITVLLFELTGLALNLLGFIPVVGQIIAWPITTLLGAVSIIIFTVWFMVLGIGFTNPKQIAGGIIGSIVELIPVVNLLPGALIAVLITISVIELEDRTGIHLPGGKTPKIK